MAIFSLTCICVFLGSAVACTVSDRRFYVPADAHDTDASPDPDAAAMPCEPTIAFISNRDGNNEIYSTNPDGTEQTNLTMSASSEQGPLDWSRTGSQLAYTRDNQIWIMNADGTEQRSLTSGDLDSRPTWAPDGTRIAFVRGAASSRIWAVDLSGNATMLSDTPSGSDSSPNWSPDGTQIAFTSDRDGDVDIYTMNADGSNEMNRTNNTSDDSGVYGDPPQWSFDGARLLFSSQRTGNYELWIMDPDGTDPINLTISTENEGYPRFWPDGSKIAFVRNPTTIATLYRMNADGTGQLALEMVASPDEKAEVSNDGRIAWRSQRDGNSEIYVANDDGSQPLRVTTNTSLDDWAVWQPCP